MAPRQVFQEFTQRVDYGRIAVSYRDLYPHLDERPTNSDPNGNDVTNPTLALLCIRGQWFLPVYSGMWIGAYVYNVSNERLLAPVTLRCTEDDRVQNLWRRSKRQTVDADPNRVDETLSWEIPQYSGLTIASQMDRALRDNGDPNQGRVNPFVVSSDPESIPAFPGGFDELTIWRRNMRAPAETYGTEENPITRGTGTFAENAIVASRVTLMWRTTAEQILRATGVVADGKPVYWVQP